MANVSSKQLVDGKNLAPLVLVGSHNGVTVIPASTPLTRLNYFDGKFLRANDLNTEQAYLRRLVELSNQTGGPGVAHGFDVALGKGDTLDLSPGLAIDPAGRVLLLPTETTLNIQDLIEQSRQLQQRIARVTGLQAQEFTECTVVSEAAPDAVPQGSDLYVITIAYAEALCGAEDVFGKLCEEACMTSTDRPYRLEGVVVRALPLILHTPLAKSQAVALTRAHLRSLVASAYYADERVQIASLISGVGLRADVWCFGAAAATGQGVPIAVLARTGTNSEFLDAWIARRERIETPAKRYWHWRMAMRPWDVYLAQILQFQCQLHELLKKAPNPGGVDDPCREERELIHEASETVSELLQFYKEVAEKFTARTGTGTSALNPEVVTLLKAGLGKGGVAQVTAMHKRLLETKKAISLAAVQRLLIRGGIVELPSAGYLPVVPGTVTVNNQVRALLGEGVHLRFCVVRPDFVAHALEEAQHMERISLLQGLDAPENKPEVDILVPNGEIVTVKPQVPGRGFAAAVLVTPTLIADGDGNRLDNERLTDFAIKASPLVLGGAGRSEILASGGATFHLAGATQVPETSTLLDLARGFAALGSSTDRRHVDLLRGVAAAAEMKPVPDAVAEVDPTTLARFIGIAARAVQYRATLRSTEQPFSEEDTDQPEGARALRPFLPVQATEGRVANLWATMSCDQDPLLLAQGAKTPAALRLVLALPGTRAIVEDFQLRGDFRADRAAVTLGNERRMTGRLAGVSSVRVSGAGTQGSERTSFIELDANVKLKTPPGEAHTLEVRLTYKKSLELVVRAKWSGQPVKAEVTVDYDLLTESERGPLRLVDVRLTENASVLTVSHPLHTVSLAAIEVVSATLADTGFADEAAQLLFPPPPPAPQELIVRGTLDWVLFHRRRNKQCADLVEKPVPAPTRRYQVYQVEAANPRVAGEIREALLQNNATALAKINFRAVGQVGFGSGVPTLTSDPEAVRADWQRVHTGDVLLYEAIATHGAGDGDTLAMQRLLHLESAVAEITPPDAKVVREVIPKVPDLLAVVGIDGTIVMLTRSAISCHTVYALIPGRSLGRVLDEDGRIREGVLEALEEVKKLNSDVLFKRGTAELESASRLEAVAAAWRTHAPNSQVGEVVVVSRQGEAASATTAYLAQSQVIATALGATQVTPRAIASPVALPGDCPAITFVTVQQVLTRTALVVFAPVDNGEHFPPPVAQASQATVTFANNAPQGNALQTLLNSLTANQPVNGIALAVLVPPPDAGAQARLQAVVNGLTAAGRPSTNVGTTAGTLSTTDRERLLRGGFTLNGIEEVIFLEPQRG